MIEEMKAPLYLHGGAGVGLAILRVSVGLLLLVHGKGGMLLNHESAGTLALFAICLGLWVGIFTRILGGIAIAGQVAYLLFIPASRNFDGVLLLPLCVAITLLGAGAYSFDGLFFGQRKVIF
jgi:hypothetical protein